jgi:hypothetical protein
MYIFSDTFFTTRHPLFPAYPLFLSPAFFFLCTIITFYFWIGLTWMMRFLPTKVDDAGEVCLALKVFFFFLVRAAVSLRRAGEVWVATGSVGVHLCPE